MRVLGRFACSLASFGISSYIGRAEGDGVSAETFAALSMKVASHEATVAQHEATIASLIEMFSELRASCGNHDSSTQPLAAMPIHARGLKSANTGSGTTINHDSIATNALNTTDAVITRDLYVDGNVYIHSRLFDPFTPTGVPTIAPTSSPTHEPTQTPSIPWYFPGYETTNYIKISAMTFPANSWTFETWVYPLEVTSGRYWFSFWSNGGDCMTFTSDFSSANAWHHVVVTWDGTTALKAYDNGELRSGIANSQGCGSGAFAGTLTLGQEQDSEGGGFDANQAPALHIDTLAIYTNTWTAVEIAETAVNSCVESYPYPPTLRSLYVGDGSGAASDVLGNNPTASVASSSTIAGHLRCRSPS